jgi:hypothetical protein
MKGELVFKHLTETLPDSISARKALLADALLIFQNSGLQVPIALMLRGLEEHEKEIARIQAELPFTNASELVGDPGILSMTSDERKNLLRKKK